MTRVEVRGALRLWLVPGVTVLLVLVLVAALGGFRSGRGAQGRPAAAEEVLDLARWQLVVHSAEVVRTDESDPQSPSAVRLRLRVTFTGQLSRYGLGPDVVSVAAPTGALDVEPFPLARGSRNGDFDPDVPQEVTLDFRWPDAPADPPPLIRVLVRDERPGENYLFDETSWVPAPTPFAHLDLPCPDQR